MFCRVASDDGAKGGWTAVIFTWMSAVTTVVCLLIGIIRFVKWVWFS
jgi:membrane protein YqaA with SNARE-associated domain